MQSRAFSHRQRYGHDGAPSYHNQGRRSQSDSNRGTSNTENGHKSSTGEEHVTDSSGDKPQGAQFSNLNANKSKPKQLICYNCNEPGHIRLNCPLRVKGVASPPFTSTPNANYISALLNGVVCNKCVVDSGSDVTCVSKRLVDSSAKPLSLNAINAYNAIPMLLFALL